MFSCFNFFNQLYEGPSDSFQGEHLPFSIKIFIGKSATLETEWSEVSEHSAVFSLQGRRPGNEDRAVTKRVKMVEGIESEGDDDVHIWAVMDGHGGDVSIKKKHQQLTGFR